VLKRSLDKKPDQFLAALNYGILLLKVNDRETALRWLRRATSIDPRSFAAWQVLARELAKHGLKDEALPAAERALRLAPGDAGMTELVRKLKGEKTPAVGPNELVIDYGEVAPVAAGATSVEPGVIDLSILRIEN